MAGRWGAHSTTRPEAHKCPQVVVSCLGKLAAFHPTARDYVLSCRAVAPLAALIHPHTPVGTAHSCGSSPQALSRANTRYAICDTRQRDLGSTPRRVGGLGRLRDDPAAHVWAGCSQAGLLRAVTWCLSVLCGHTHPRAQPPPFDAVRLLFPSRRNRLL